MKKKAIVFLLLILVVGAGAFWAHQEKEETEDANEMLRFIPANSFMITDSFGFMPKNSKFHVVSGGIMHFDKINFDSDEPLTSEELQIIEVVKGANQEEIEELVNQMSAFTYQEYVYQKVGDLYLISNSQEFLEEVQKEDFQSIVGNEEYLSLKGKLPKDKNNLSAILMPNALGLDNNPIESAFMVMDINYENELESVLSEGEVRFNPEQLAKWRISIGSEGDEFSLAKKIINNNSWFLLEISDFADKLRFIEDIVAKNHPLGNTVVKNGKKQFEISTGLNLEEDIYAWLDKSVAIYVSKSETEMPDISLLVDVSSNSEKAQEIINKANQYLSLWLQLDENLNGKIKISKLDNGFTRYKLKEGESFSEAIEFENFLQERGISWGINEDSILVITSADLDNLFPTEAKDLPEGYQKGKALVYWNMSFEDLPNYDQIKDIMNEYYGDKKFANAYINFKTEKNKIIFDALVNFFE